MSTMRWTKLITTHPIWQMVHIRNPDTPNGIPIGGSDPDGIPFLIKWNCRCVVYFYDGAVGARIDVCEFC